MAFEIHSRQTVLSASPISYTIINEALFDKGNVGLFIEHKPIMWDPRCSISSSET